MWWTEYVGIPFVEKGRDRGGVDCWGLVNLIYREKLGIELPSYAENYRDTNDRAALQALVEAEKAAKWVAVEKPKPYDAVVLTMLGMPTHVGIMVDDRHMLHCMRGTNTVREDITGLRWRHRVKGFARWAL